VPHILRPGISVFKVISKRPVILTSECRALDEGAITSYFNVLGLMQPARVELDLMTSRIQSKSTTTRLPQPVAYVGTVHIYVGFSLREYNVGIGVKYA
jgi:hypothetical protein